jgi:hypothetical protein
MFYIEAAQERLPGPVDLLVRGPGAGGPQPYWVRVPLAGQVIDLEPDEGTLDEIIGYDDAGLPR